MERILIQIKNKPDRELLEKLLDEDFEIVTLGQDQAHPMDVPFDLAILDGPTLKVNRRLVMNRRKEEEPVLLPFLLLATRRKGTFPTRHLGNLVDDLIFRPLDKDELEARVANLLRMRRLSLELKKEHDRVVKLSVTDDVSGFHNTRYLHRYLDRLIDSQSGSGKFEEVSLVFFDLDNFKQVVDTHGHLKGAKVLREVAQTVSKVLDEEDRIVRYGGDEYVVILPRQNKEQAVVKVSRMQEALTSTYYLEKEGLNVQVTASFGVATFPYDARDKKELLAEADHCLFKSKSRGKNRISFAGMEQEPGEQLLEEL
ncbi:MAG: putative Diguanylate cyclase [Verrucomicrobiales bacterium]|nr:putative Diguanylate cyclase [Verrucomicrobiales bacterium]